MPEGDTLFRTAHTLRRALAGGVVRKFFSSLPALQETALEGHTVTAVEARGKNLLIHFDDGRALYSHLRMEGSWHIYRPGEAWQRPERQARVWLETENWVAVGFNLPVLELLTALGLRRHALLSRLGPDLLGDDFPYEEALARLRTRNAAPIGEAIMRQDTVAGVGNVYKSEVLFLCRYDPFQKVVDYTDAELKAMLVKARELMQANLTTVKRTTRNSLDGGRVWVYNRSGQPCRKCGTLIRMRRQGMEGRSTYWCPQCQSNNLAAEPDPPVPSGWHADRTS